MTQPDIVKKALAENLDQYKPEPKIAYETGDDCPLCDGKGKLDRPVVVRTHNKKSTKTRIWEALLELAVIIGIFFMLDWIWGHF